MHRNNCFSLAGILALSLFTRCERCEDLTERKFGLVFYENNRVKHLVFQQVKGLGGNGEITLQNDSLYHLPISLHQDSSTYILINDQNVENKITISYKREFIYEGNKCGFRVRFSEFSKGKSTTYPNVTVVGEPASQGQIFWGNGPKEEIYEVRVDL